ncbi:UDP-glucose 4-epimerase GalE [Synechococcus sp. CBW1006]|uniref:UDP-glucose 4-epimerase GalE n=1 Tax=Synechococcus sp. CBW1006 TaxID=1353138 RepID=UPI0018CDC4B0|nr:UDP-glucose 4-epimerase GalE [Synechococcus sp. CBW1006]QPN68603.1 UDP-glucose 4-epimerase GalE [Synechococcus sp. CBW1006]
MRVLVTGGAGLIGSHAVRALQRAGFEPVVLDNLVFGHRRIVEQVLGVPLVVAQLDDRQQLDRLLAGQHPDAPGASVGAVLHFAAFAYVGESVQDPARYYRNNVAGSLTLLEALIDPRHQRSAPGAAAGPMPLVFSSTCATYGIPAADQIPIRETTPQNPINPYGRSKWMIEQLLADFHLAYGLPATILRYFNAAGADPASDLDEDHTPETHLIPLVLEALAGRRSSICIYGSDYPTPDGTCIRDYIHVCDLADAHVLALQQLQRHGGLHHYNLGTGRGHSVLDVITTARRVTGLELQIDQAPRRPGDPPVLVASAEKAAAELGWQPRFPDLATTIEHAWRWCQRSCTRV